MTALGIASIEFFEVVFGVSSPSEPNARFRVTLRCDLEHLKRK
jgi:hypothetical protein